MVDTITVGYELTNTCLKHCGDFTGTNSSNGQSWKIVNGGCIYHSSLEELYSEFDNIDVGGDKTRICDKFKVFRHFSLRNNILVECDPLFTLSFKIVI